MRLSTLALCASLLQVTLASPLFSPFPPSSEPTLLRPNADLAAGLTCPGVSDLTKLKNPILLQPGTGLTAEQSYTYGYVKIASTLGYEPCLVATQHALLNDTQDSVEFLVYAVQQLSRYAPDGKVPLFTWSLGGPLAQWMFTFWPSTRKQVKQLIALAPDFRGANFAKIANNVILGEPSLYQQAPNSTWLKALKSHSGLNGWVPTTVIYSADDEIVQPEDGPEASSVLSDVRSVGVRNVKVQDLCGEKFSMHHFDGLQNDITYQITKLALQSGTMADVSKIANTTESCAKKCASPPLTKDDCKAGADIPQFLGNYFKGPHAFKEPKLRSYVK